MHFNSNFFNFEDFNIADFFDCLIFKWELYQFLKSEYVNFYHRLLCDWVYHPQGFCSFREIEEILTYRKFLIKRVVYFKVCQVLEFQVIISLINMFKNNISWIRNSPKNYMCLTKALSKAVLSTNNALPIKSNDLFSYQLVF